MSGQSKFAQFPVKPQAARGEMILYLRGGYVLKIGREVTIPIGSLIDLELSDGENVTKPDWYFNNSDVVSDNVSDNGKRSSVRAVGIGTAKCLIRPLGLELVINVTGAEAVGFDVEHDASADEYEE